MLSVFVFDAVDDVKLHTGGPCLPFYLPPLYMTPRNPASTNQILCVYIALYISISIDASYPS